MNNNYLPSLYQQYIHLSRYARWLYDENRRETWPETVKRYFDFFEGHLDKKHNYKMDKETRDSLENAVLNLESLPSMRALMTAGPALERENVAGYNCFGAETKFLTKEGVMSFLDVVDQEVEVWTKLGWKKAKVQNFGIQPLQKVTFRPTRTKSNVRNEVLVTPNHRWITRNRGEVTDLKLGDVIESNVHTTYNRNIEAFIRGFGFGDGTIDNRGRGKVRLCGEKDLKLMEIFKEFGHASIWYPEKMNGDALIVYHKGYMENWKKLPYEYIHDADYLSNWLEGYMEADGTRYEILSSQNSEAIKFVESIAAFCGYVVTGKNTLSSMETNYGTRKNPLIKLTLKKESEFFVTSIEMMDEDEVFCVIEPETQTFTLDFGALTGNCAFIAIDNLRSFDEILYVLMNGTGIGFSVEQKYVDQLPVIADDFHKTDTTVFVADSKLGWAKALKEIIHLLSGGQIPKWDVSKVRPAGAPLKTFGGRASGPEPLVDLFEFVTASFRNAAGRRLTTLECHDIVCKIADIVVVGGVRRSALISLSDLFDDRMRTAKSGKWWEISGQRALANNSFVANQKPDIGIFMKEWLSLYESKSGERGIFSREASKNQVAKNGRRNADFDFGTNPCSEIILRSRQFCNLTEVVVRATDSIETLKKKVELATILGTMQSTLTNFRYLSRKWKENCEEERLLGVSLTGIMDNEILNGSNNHSSVLETILVELKQVAIETNKKWAAIFGINQSTAITCVKPSGTVSQLVDSASGIHARHAPYYIRTVRNDRKDPLAKMMIDMGFPYEPDVTKPNHTLVFSFPQKSPEGAVFRKDRTAIEQLELWLIYQRHWAEHKPSITVSVKEDEWLEVGAWVYKHFSEVSGVSFLPFSDTTYRQMPYQDCTKEEYEELLSIMPTHVDWSKLIEYEGEDLTKGSQELACVSGICEI